MTSIFQRKKSPVGRMARIVSISVSYITQIDIDYGDLELRIVDGRLCFYYKSDDGDWVMPIIEMEEIKRLK